MRQALFILLLLPLASLAITESEFYNVCTSLSHRIESASSTVHLMDTMIANERDNAYARLSYYSNLATSPNATDYQRGQYDGAKAIFDDFATNSSSYDHLIAGVNSDLQNAQTLINELRWTDFEGYLSSISNSTLQTLLTARQIDIDVTNGFRQVYNQFQSTFNEINAIGNFLFARSDMQEAVRFQDICDHLLEWGFRAMDFYDLFFSIEDEFKRYFELVNSRVEHPDSSLAGDLNQMWLNCLANVHKVVNRPDLYHLQDQTSFLASDSSLRLSNEGMIMAENLAVNQRNYLCTVEALRKLEAMTNALDRLLVITNQTNVAEVDLSGITNYLWDVQSTFYKEFNKVGMRNGLFSDNQLPYQSIVIHYFTNYVAWAQRLNENPNNSNLTSARASFLNFRNSYTNFFDRLEFYLLNMQGLIPMPGTNVSYTPSDTSYNDNVNQSTNSVYDVLNVANTVGERFEQVKEKFGELLSSFKFNESGGNWSVIQLSPSFTVMNRFEIPALEIPYADIEGIVFACRVVFSALWYIVFGFIGFRLVYLTITLFVKMITHTILIVSTLMSGT